MNERRGFTLFELVLVMAIVLIIGALASPLVFQGLDGQAKVNAAADMVRARWADCRTQAIEECRPYRFAVIPNSGKFKIEPYTGQSATSMGAEMNAMSGGSSGTTGGLVYEDRLPKPVRFGTADVPVDADSDEPDGGDYVDVAIFLPTGGAKFDTDVIFGAKGANQVTLHLRALTGAATTIRPKVEESP